MTTTKKAVLFFGSLVVVAILGFATILALFYFSMTKTVMTKHSPNGKHTAKLVRVSGMDVNFVVRVDGSEVYRSPDFGPVQTDYREQVLWDKNSQMVALEVAGRRIFGYHTAEKRVLKDDEMSRFEFVPFEELRFEGRVPGR